jgi:DNA-binding MurR/RpiR family transcriptional regulator
MQESPLAPLLKDRFDELPSQMQVAARWLTGHPLEVALLSMREQARRAGVPAATMSRIAKRLGFDGFDALKALHAKLLREPPSSYQARAEHLIARQRGHSEQSLIVEMLSTSEQQLRQLASSPFVGAMEAAAETLSKADRVFCVASRACFSVAFLYHYVRSLVSNDSVLLDGAGGIGIDSLRTATPKDALLAISVAPYTRQTLDAALFASERKAKVVVITDSSLSPLARAADTAIIVPTDTASFFPSMTPSLAAAECLAALVAVKRGESALAALAESERQLSAFGAYVISPRGRSNGNGRVTSHKRKRRTG